MHQEVRIAGMGGQGIMLAGQLLAYATVLEEGNVVWFPAYGPETRGGSAECTVIISDQEIGSPVSSSPHTLIAMTQPLLDKFAPAVRREGLIIINSSLAQVPQYRDDCKLIAIPANELAEELGSAKVANMILLGAFVQMVKPVKLESVEKSLEEAIHQRNHALIPLNVAALRKGAELAASL